MKGLRSAVQFYQRRVKAAQVSRYAMRVDAGQRAGSSHRPEQIGVLNISPQFHKFLNLPRISTMGTSHLITVPWLLQDERKALLEEISQTTSMKAAAMSSAADSMMMTESVVSTATTMAGASNRSTTTSRRDEMTAAAAAGSHCLLPDEFLASRHQPRAVAEGQRTVEGRQQAVDEGRSRDLLCSEGGQFHSEGGRTDGCYALYGSGSAAGSDQEKLDKLLVQLKVCSHRLIA